MGEKVEIKSDRVGRWWVLLWFKIKGKNFTNIKEWRVGCEMCGDEPVGDFVYVKWTVFTPLQFNF